MTGKDTAHEADRWDTENTSHKSMRSRLLGVLAKLEGHKEHQEVWNAGSGTYDTIIEDARVSVDGNARTVSIQPPLSRRSFLKLAAACSGVLVLDSVFGGFTGYAYADEGTTSQWIIRVVARWEVGIVVVDPTNPDTPSVAGAKVSVSSSYNDKHAEKLTDTEGIAIFDIRDLSEPDPYGRSLFQFWGSILIEKEGYRTYKTGKARFLGAQSIAAATQPHNNKAYARLITFDEYDIQYAKEVCFAKTGYNDVEHSLVVEVVEPAEQQLTISYYHRDTFFEEQRVAVQNGIAKAEFKRKWLSSALGDSWWAFTVGKQTQVRVRNSRETFSITTTLSVIDGCIQDSSEGTRSFAVGSYQSALGEEMPEGITITAPSAFPKPIGGTKIEIWIPEFPVQFGFDPLGFVMLGVAFSGSFYTRKNGTVDNKGWKLNERKSCSDQWEKQKADWSKSWEDYKNTVNPSNKTSKFGTFGKGTKLEIKAQLAALGYGKWDWFKGTWGAEFQGLAEIALKYAYSQQFTFGPVPAYLGFDFSVAARLLPLIGFSIKGTDFGSIAWVPKSPGINIQFNLGVGVSVGVGISGLVSLGVRGYGELGFYVGLVPTRDSKPMPHLVFSGAIGVSWVLQVFVAKINGVIWDQKWPDLYDNWKSATDYEQGIFSSPIAETPPLHEEFNFADGVKPSFVATPYEEGDPLPDLLALESSMVVVSNAELGMTKEYTARLTGGEPGMEEYAYDYFEDDGGSVTGLDCSDLGIAAVGEKGVRPTSEIRIYKDVYSNPLPQVAHIGATQYLFRIITVEYPGSKLRTRLTVSRFEGGTWGAPKVIDYDFGLSGHSRKDMYDYDFDICAHPSGGSWADGSSLRLILTFGTRPQADSSSINEITTNMGLSFLALDQNLNVKYHDDHVEIMYNSTLAYGYFLMMPRIVNTANSGTAVAVIGRRVGKSDSPFDESKAADEILYHYYRNNAAEESSPPLTYARRDASGGPRAARYDFRLVHAGTVVEPNASEEDGGTTERVDCIGIYFLGPSPYAGENRRALSYTHLYPGKESYGFIHSEEGIQSIVPGGESSVLGMTNESSASGKAQVVSITPRIRGLGDYDFVINSVGPEKIQVERFTASADGRWLYYTMIEDGARTDLINQDGTITPQEPQKLYQIYASKRVSGRFIDVFPFVELVHAPDTLAHFAIPDGSALLFNSITDMKRSASDIYYASVPHVKCVTVLSFASAESLVGAGEDAEFSVKVRNDGNTIVERFTLTVTDVQGTIIGQIPLVTEVGVALPQASDVILTEEATELSAMTDPMPGFGEEPWAFDVATTAGALLPGRERSYRVILRIPVDWQGTRELFTKVDAGSIIVSSLQGYAEDADIVESALDAAAVLSFDAVGTTVTLREFDPGSIGELVSANRYYYLGYVDGPNDIPRTDDGAPLPLFLASFAALLGLGGIALAHRFNTTDSDEDAAH